MRTVNLLKTVALLPLGFLVVVAAFFGVAEAVGGDLTGLMHLVQALIGGLVMWWCWKRPLWGGVILLIVALYRVILMLVSYFRADPGSVISASIVPFALLVFSGILLVAAAWLGRPRTAAEQ